jgi:uncharacterized damage-inducible protein DinB
LNDPSSAVLFSADELHEHWQGHRRLTRRVIEAFPEDKLFTFSVGGMRPFAQMSLEMISMAASGVAGLATRKWRTVSELPHHQTGTTPTTRAELLRLWDATTAEMDEAWPKIPAGRFREVDRAFGEWEGVVYGLVFYWIDNEIHHRGQGYVYLRALGIEPPGFWER